MAAMVALGVVHQADPVLDLEYSAVTLERLIGDVSAKTGETLVVDDPLKGEIVSLRLKGMASSKFKERLADTVYGKWVEKSDGLTFVLDKGRIEDLRKAEDRAVTQRIREAKESIRKVLNGTYDFGELDEESQEYLDSMAERFSQPSFQLWALGALQIPDSVLAGMTDGKRTVYSTHPLRGQGQLNAAGMVPIITGLIAELNQEIEESNKAFEDISDQDYEGEYAVYSRLMKERMAKHFPRPRLEGAPAKVIVTLTGERELGSGHYYAMPMVELRVLGRDGRVMVMASDSLEAVADIVEELKLVREYEETEEDQPVEVDQSPMLKIAPEVLDYLATLDSMSYSELDREATDQARQMRLKPTEYEPLDWAVGKALLSSCLQVDRQYISLIEDYDFEDVLWMIGSGGLRASWLDTYFIPDSGEAEEPLVIDGISILRPQYPDGIGKRRISRSDIELLATTQAQRYVLPLDMFSDFAAKYPDANDFSLVTSYWDDWQSSGLLKSAFRVEDSWEKFVLWGSLSEPQRNRLRGGGTVMAPDLSIGAKRVLENSMYLDVIAPGSLADMSISPGWSAYGSVLLDRQASFYDNFLEPSEFTAGGLPRYAYLQASVRKGDYLIPVGIDGKLQDGSFPITLEEMALIRLVMEGQETLPENGIPIEQFIAGDHSDILLGFFVAPQTGVKFSYVDRGYPDLANVFGKDDFPEDLGERLLAAWEAMNASEEIELIRAYIKMMQSWDMDDEEEVIKPLD